ncbi:MAG: protein kinase [Candidatus Aminicenantes bacterium]|nr:MAG: protein kinase [Candidatus Aminicenantes bacterium]
MSIITWLHISDLHMCGPMTGWDANRILASLKDDFKKLQDQHQLCPDLIFVTGDIAYGEIPGYPIMEQFQEAGALLEEIRESFSPTIPINNVFIVPGNHDVNRNSVTPDQTYWLDQQTDLNRIFDLVRSHNIQWRRYMERLEEYCSFLNKFGYTHLLGNPHYLMFNSVRTISGLKVGIAGFNSAWSSCRNSEKGKLWLAGKWQLETLLQKIKKADVSIALMHHPFNWLVDKEDPEFGRLLENHFNFFLHGHEHLGWVDQKPQHARIAASSCYDRTGRDNGYNMVRLDTKNRKCDIWLRCYDRQGDGWVHRPISRYAENGIWSIKNLDWLPKIKKKKEPSKKRQKHLPEMGIEIPGEYPGPPGGAIPDSFGLLRPICELGRGSFGVVYLVRHGNSRVVTAVKQFTPERFKDDVREEAYERFVRGIRIMRDLVHPGVIRIYEVENSGINNCYYNMEYCKLGSLQGFARRAAKNNIPFGLAEKINLVISLCNTVSYAHSRDTVHRDIKPTNILISVDDETGELFPKLADFDLAFQRGDTGLTYGPMGSIFFLPPEIRSDLSRQESETLMHYIPSLRSRAEKVDVYALGGVLYYLLTNCYPPLGEFYESTREIERIIVNVSNPWEREVFKALAYILQNVLNPEESLRPSSAEELRGLIQEAYADPGSFRDRYSVEFSTADIDLQKDKTFSYAYLEPLSHLSIKTIMENLDETCILVVQDHVIHFATPSLGSFTNKSLSEFIENPVLPLPERDYQEEFSLVKCEDEILSSGKKVKEYALNLQIGESGIKSCRIKGKVVHWNGKPAVMFLFRDVTQEEQLHEQLLQSQRMETMGKLVGGFAHDFNNILVGIFGYSELLQDEIMSFGSDRAKKCINYIFSAAQRASDLTKQILTFSRKKVYKVEKISLNELINEIMKLFRSTLPATIELLVDLSPKDLTLNADAGQIHQVLMNIITNAAQAMPQGGRITLRTKRVKIKKMQKDKPDSKPGTYAYISVSDTGTGMKKEVLTRIFDPFFTTKKQGEGTGMGLAVVHGIVKSLGGWISVDSEFGVGTSFHLYFPLISEEDEKKTIETRAHLPVIPVTILVNEPNDDVRQAMLIALQQQGHTVFEAKNGQEAIYLAVPQEKPVNLLITASIFPGISTRELIDRMRKINPDIKIIYTYTDYRDFKRQGLKENEVELLEKPFSLKGLLKKIQEIFQQA